MFLRIPWRGPPYLMTYRCYNNPISNGCTGPPYMSSPGASRTMQPSAGSPYGAQVLFGSIRFGRFPVDVPPQKSNIDLDTNTDGPPFVFWSTALGSRRCENLCAKSADDHLLEAKRQRVFCHWYLEIHPHVVSGDSEIHVQKRTANSWDQKHAKKAPAW